MDDRDPVVARALASVQPPPHRADFWQRLDRSLAQTAALGPAPTSAEPESSAPPVTPVPLALPGRDDTTVVELHRTTGDDGGGDAGHDRPARRTVRFPIRLLASAAVIVAVVVAGVWVAGRGDDELGPDLSTAGPTNTAADGAGEEIAPETTTPPETAPADPRSTPRSVVLSFVDALGTGDFELAKTLLGPRSEQTMIERFGSVDAYLHEASEGYGAWAASEDRTVEVVELREGEAVVVLRGTIRPEGMEEHRVTAFPARRAESVGDYWFIEPLASYEPGAPYPPITLDLDPARPVVTIGEPVVLDTPAAGTAFFSLGGEPAVAVETEPGGAGHRASWTPSDAPAGQALLTVAFVSDTHFAALALDVTVG